MRTALSFWQMPEDDQAFMDFLRSTGRVMARRHRSLPAEQAIEFEPLSAFRRRGSGLYLLCRDVDLDSLKIDVYQAYGQSWRTVCPFGSQILTLARKKPVRGHLPRCSIGAHWHDRHSHPPGKPKKDRDFIKWGKSVIAWVQARCSEKCRLHGFDYPATPAVVEALEAGEIALGS
ncbi:MAG: hypothetical protein FJ271_00390 [Planctomycetes bacterium]|nr:hypothetical protein [Planctomycetota bacterium]